MVRTGSSDRGRQLPLERWVGIDRARRSRQLGSSGRLCHRNARILTVPSGSFSFDTPHHFIQVFPMTVDEPVRTIPPHGGRIERTPAAAAGGGGYLAAGGSPSGGPVRDGPPGRP